jgi:glycosyltransferase involved in cell wall biosynthesis
MNKISVVVPIFNEEKLLKNLHSRIIKAMDRVNLPFEIIFVNDGSQDKTEEIGRAITPLNLITLQRNYGQTAALDVGISHANGDIVVLIDADLQNDPEDILLLLNKINQGYDVVVGWRQIRKDHWTRKIFSKLANFIARKLLNLDIHDFGCGLKVYRTSFIKDFRLWGEAQVFLPAVAKQRGAKITEVPVPHYPREIGVSKIRIMNMVRGIFDLLGIVFFVRYFARPLRFFGGLGLISGIMAAISFIIAIALRLAGVLNFTETPLPIVGTLFTILAVLLFMIGFLAEMLLRLHYDLKQSSPYMIKEIIQNK